MKLVYIDGPWYEDQEPTITLQDLQDVSNQKLEEVIDTALTLLIGRKAQTNIKENIKRHLGLKDTSEIKALEKLKLRSSEVFYMRRYGNLVTIDPSRPIQQYILDDMKAGTDFYVCVELPKELQKQVDAHKAKLEKKSKEAAIKKKEREIAKAKKILAQLTTT